MAARNRAAAELPLNLLASLLTGAAAVVTFNPLDCLRVRWQVLPEAATGNSLSSFASSIVRSEGLLRGLWLPGLGANTVAISMSSGLRLGTYPVLRDTLTAAVGAEVKNPTTMFASSLLAGCVSYFIAAPFWLCKTRLQAEAGAVNAEGVLTSGARAGHPPKYKHFVDVARQIASDEGVAQLWRGASVICVRGALITGGQLTGYDWTKTYCRQEKLLEDGPVLHGIASVVAALAATTFGAPFDILMVRFQTAPAMERSYDGLVDCATTMVKEEGPLVFYRGWWPMFVRIAPTFLLAMPLYEQIRKGLGLSFL